MTRAIKALAAFALAGASILGVTSQASADPNPSDTGSYPMWITLGTPDHVGVYSCAYADCSKVDNLTLSPPNDQVLVDCWVSGGTVGNAGDVWYRTSAVIVNGNYIEVSTPSGGPAWTFGPYVDFASAWRNSPLPHC
ncbi:MAG: hypothetical protein HOY79_23965 [Streptomyces sp.]|nr:hypothetical protein [Streptomyces sp.]